MALSASKTQEQNNLVQTAIQERKRKEQLQRKQQAEREAKEREVANKMRLRHFEEEKREQERRKRMEEVAKAREAALQKKKDEQRDALLYGPKKASSVKSSSSSSGSGAGSKERRRGALLDDDDDDSPSGLVLTREELRERKLQAEMRRLYGSTKRTTTAHSYSKPGRRLPGGAVDIQTTQQGNSDALQGKSVKDRISAMPNMLMKLNTVKRDTRTIDEIRTDLQRKKEGKILDGDDAKSFDDWFSTKKKDPVRKVQAQSDSVNSSGANTPTYSASAAAPSSSSSATAKRLNSSSTPVKPAKSSALKAPIPKSSSQPTSARSANSSRAASLDKHPAPRGSFSQGSRPLKHSSTAERERDRYGSSRPSTSVSAHSRKRPRSESGSESPPPKRRASSRDDEDLSENISSAIWSMFGKKRDKYIGIDVFSDDEDMEADADALEREEMYSARIAKREDLEALEEERRHEEEKRRRKKEKDRFSRQ